MGFKWDIKSRIAAHTADLDAHIKDLREQTKVGECYAGCGMRASFNSVVTANRLYGYILFVARTMTFDQIRIDVEGAGAGGTAARLGIYELDSDLAPGALIKDHGTVAVDSTGVKSVNGDQQLTRGYYLGAFITDGTPTIKVVEVSFSPLGIRSSGGVVDQVWDGYYVDQAYGALPDPFPASPTLNRHIPAVVLRVKSLD